MTARVAVVIVSWNVQRHLRRCLRSLREVRMPLHIIVVDNASGDGTAAMVQAEFPEVTLIAQTENVGFAVATNRGLRQADGDAWLLLNPDTEVRPDAIGILLACLDAMPDVGAAGPLIRTPAGRVDFQAARRFPTPLTQALDWSGLTYRWPRLAWHLIPGWDHLTSRRVECLSGACVLLRRRAVEAVGLLDEGYFLYVEDMDLFRRMAQAGWKHYYCAAAEVVHYGGRSTGQVKVSAGLASLRSHHRFFAQHYGQGSARLYRWLILCVALAKWSGYSLLARVSVHAEQRPLLTEQARAYRAFARWALGK